MNDYRQTLDIDADPSAVYAALTTADGIRGWWTRDSDLDPSIGGTLRVRFGAHRKAMRIDQLAPARKVHWLCTAAHIAAASLPRPDEWVGTRIVFRLSPIGGGRTRLGFEHIGLAPALACYDMCSSGWQHYLESLRRYAESGVGTPHGALADATA